MAWILRKWPSLLASKVECGGYAESASIPPANIVSFKIGEKIEEYFRLSYNIVFEVDYEMVF